MWSLYTFDFKTLYTNIPHDKLKRAMRWVINEAFRHASEEEKEAKLSIYNNTARFTFTQREGTVALTARDVLAMIDTLIDNIYM